NQKFNELQGKLYEAEAAKSLQEQDLKHAREMKAQRVRELEHLTRQLEEIRAREGRETQRLAELREALARDEAAVGEAQSRNEQAQKVLREADEAALSQQSRWDEFLARSEGATTQLEAERVRVQQLDRALMQAEERLNVLTTEQAKLDAAPIQAALFDADTELKNIQRSIGDAQALLAELDRKIAELRDSRATAEGALHEARQSLQGARGRLSSLETLQAAALRQDDAELNAWLQKHGLEEAPRLAAALQVESGWEGAVEHVLGDLLQAPLIADFADKLGGIHSAPKSGVNLLHSSAGVATSHAERLSAKVVGPGVVMELLHGIFVANDIAQARATAASLHAGESVITKDGVWLGKDWARYPRTHEDETGVLARAMLLKQLRAEVEAQASSVREKEKHVDELRISTQTLETQRRDIAARFDDGRSKEARSLAFRQAQSVRLEQTESRAKQLAQEITALTASRETLKSELVTAQKKSAELDAIAQKLRDERGALQQAVSDSRVAAQRARAAALETGSALNAAQLELATKRSALEGLNNALRDLAAQREARERERVEIDGTLAQYDAPIENQAQGAASAMAAVQAAEFDRDAARDRLQQAQIESQGLTVRRQTLSDQIVETGIDRNELLAAIKDDATPEVWDEKVLSMGRRIERLRETELGKQNDDITGALATLEEAMRKIDRETQERFKDTFDRVDAIFRDRFPKLFGGGEAYLEMTGEDLLDTGVRVMARPPGKRNSSIQLLSRGVLPDGRSRCAARRRQRRALLRDRAGDGAERAVHYHHAQQDHDGARRPAARRDHAGAGRVPHGQRQRAAGGPAHREPGGEGGRMNQLPLNLTQLQLALLIFGVVIVLLVILFSRRDKGNVKTDP